MTISQARLVTLCRLLSGNNDFRIQGLLKRNRLPSRDEGRSFLGWERAGVWPAQPSPTSVG